MLNAVQRILAITPFSAADTFLGRAVFLFLKVTRSLCTLLLTISLHVVEIEETFSRPVKCQLFRFVFFCLTQTFNFAGRRHFPPTYYLGFKIISK